MQVLKKYVFLLMSLFLVGCKSAPVSMSSSSGQDTYYNESSYESFNLINNDSVKDGNFRVGMLLPLTGEAAKYGNGLKNASLMALDDVKADNLILQFYDTKSTSSGARIAAEAAINQNAQLIIGPLTSNAVKAIKDETSYRNVPVIAFSTDASVLQPKVYTMGLLVKEQVNRIIAYAASQGRSRFALLLPDDETGIAIAKAAVITAQQHGVKITRIAFYRPNTTDFAEPVKQLSDFSARSARLKRIKGSLGAQSGNINAQRALKRLERAQALGDVDFDAVIIPESGAKLKAALAMFGYYDIYSPKVRFLGTAIWENTDLSRETMASGSWFPALSRSHSNYFINKYGENFGEKPNSLYSLAYDAVALSAALAKKNETDINTAITSPEGYIGINGVFRLFPNGTNEHSLDVMEVSSSGDKTINQAPRRFTADSRLLMNEEIYVDSNYQAPYIFGKNKEAAEMAIYGQILSYENQPNSNTAQNSESEIVRKALKDLNVVIP